MVSSIVSAQRVSNVAFYQSGKSIVITYSLSERADVSVYMSTDGGRKFKYLEHVTGDVGAYVTPGEKRIEWDVMADYDEFIENNVVFKVSAYRGKNYDFDRVSFSSYMEAGAATTFGSWGYLADLSMGIRIKKYVYLGVEIGFTQLIDPLHYVYNTGLNTYDFYSNFWCIPAGLNMRVYFPGKNCIRKRIYPYVNITGGAYYGTPYYMAADNTAPTFSDVNPLSTEFDADWQKHSFGVYAQAGLGIDFSRFTMGMGYTLTRGDIVGGMGYFKIGVRLGRY